MQEIFVGPEQRRLKVQRSCNADDLGVMVTCVWLGFPLIEHRIFAVMRCQNALKYVLIGLQDSGSFQPHFIFSRVEREALNFSGFHFLHKYWTVQMNAFQANVSSPMVCVDIPAVHKISLFIDKPFLVSILLSPVDNFRPNTTISNY